VYSRDTPPPPPPRLGEGVGEGARIAIMMAFKTE